jgi:hypothetical protein
MDLKFFTSLFFLIIFFISFTGCTNTQTLQPTTVPTITNTPQVIVSQTLKQVTTNVPEKIATTARVPIIINYKGEPGWVAKSMGVYAPEGWVVKKVAGYVDQLDSRDEFSFISFTRFYISSPQPEYISDEICKIYIDGLMEATKPKNRNQAQGIYSVIGYSLDPNLYIINGIPARHATIQLENDVTLEHVSGDYFLFLENSGAQLKFTELAYFHRMSADPRDVENSKKIMETYHST